MWTAKTVVLDLQTLQTGRWQFSSDENKNLSGGLKMAAEAEQWLYCVFCWLWITSRLSRNEEMLQKNRQRCFCSVRSKALSCWTQKRGLKVQKWPRNVKEIVNLVIFAIWFHICRTFLIIPGMSCKERVPRVKCFYSNCTKTYFLAVL